MIDYLIIRVKILIHCNAIVAIWSFQWTSRLYQRFMKYIGEALISWNRCHVVCSRGSFVRQQSLELIMSRIRSPFCELFDLPTPRHRTTQYRSCFDNIDNRISQTRNLISLPLTVAPFVDLNLHIFHYRERNWLRRLGVIELHTTHLLVTINWVMARDSFGATL